MGELKRSESKIICSLGMEVKLHYSMYERIADVVSIGTAAASYVGD